MTARAPRRRDYDPTADAAAAPAGPDPARPLAPWTEGQLASLEAMAVSLELQAAAMRQQISGLRAAAVVYGADEGPAQPPGPAGEGAAAAGQGPGEYYHPQFQRRPGGS